MKKISVFLVSLFLSVSTWAAIDALQFSSAQQEQDYHRLTEALRCPQCQNNNIADSNATIAVDMRHKVFELLQEGKSKQDIIDYMVLRYGNFVTYDPPFTVATAMLWFIPLALIIIGIYWALRRRHKTQVVSNVLTDKQQSRLQSLLNEKE